MGEDGNYYYRTANGISNIVAHNNGARTAAETAFIQANLEEMNVATIAKAAKANGTMRKAVKRGTRTSSQVPNTGSPKIPVLLVQYKDIKFKDSDPMATFESFFNEGSTSAYQYFVDQSNGAYTPQFELYGPVTLSKNRVSYGGNDSDGYDIGVGAMVGEACNSLNSSIDFSQYDNDKDGECDVVIVIYAGVGEASSDVSNSIWPCQWDLASSDYGKNLTLDNTTVSKFAVFNELYYDANSDIDGIGTFCHEYSHCLDLPDLYDTNYGAHFGMGPWSILDYGCYNNDGYTPIGYSAYEKAFMGWIDLNEGEENTYYTLPVFNQKSKDTDFAVKLTNAKDKNEYYILENRAQQGWDKYMPYEGMLITHITYSASAWSGNSVNDYDLQRVTPIPADNTLKLDKTSYGYTFNEADLAGDLWPYGNATELTNESTPAAKVNTGSYMSKPVTEISKNPDGTVSFWVMKADLPAVAQPVNLAANVNSSTAATISWEPGDNTDITYTLEVSKHKDITYEHVSSNDFNNNSTWETSGSVNTDSAGDLYIGSSKKTGAVISPAFTTDEEGIVSVIFNAKYYGSDKSSVKVSLLNAGKTAITSETISLTDEFKDYCVVFDGYANTKSYIKIESTASKKRVYLTTADIYLGDASDVLASDAPARTASADTKTFTGITDTFYKVTDLEAYGTYDYRVKAVPVDTDSYNASAWTEKDTFTLSDQSAVSAITIDDNAAAEYFTTQGVRINGVPTTPGIYIRRQGTTTTKVMVKE
jgi:M6 family metalloprotease-like protein